jgi:acetate kinase
MTAPRVLVLNAGSSSIKAAVLEVASDGTCNRLWQDQHAWTMPSADGTNPELIAAVERCLTSWLPAVLAPWQGSLTLVAHRVVHGGERFSRACRIDAEVRRGITAVSALAPLHNGVALAVIDWMETWLAPWQPGLPQWACFDTAFHSTLPVEQSTYALPAPWRQQGLRRFGFHGLNHQHVAETVNQLLGEEGQDPGQLQDLRLISAHLGAGCSLCAISQGRSVATTMGLTPLEGLVMGSRSGSVDPGLLLHLLQHQGLSAAEIDHTLNHRSGLLGLSELSSDMRQLRQAAAAGHPGSQLAIAVFTARLLEGIGAMAAVLRGVDVIALSGGIGQNDEQLAHDLHQQLQWLGRFRLLQIPADEEGQIARQCLQQVHSR